MIYKTRGIVLRTVNYANTSIIVKIYTEKFGLQSYLIKGARRKNTSIKANLFQPLSLLELVVYQKEKKQLQLLKEAGTDIHFISIPNNPVKTSIVLFLNEVLTNCLQEEENNPELFSFIHESMQTFDNLENNFTNFHLIFLTRFSRFLGFFPQGNFSEENFIFDLREGQFVSKEPMHHDFIEKENSKLLGKLIFCNYYSMGNLALSGKERKNLLDILLHFYQLHLSNMANISSHKVLEQIFA